MERLRGIRLQAVSQKILKGLLHPCAGSLLRTIFMVGCRGLNIVMQPPPGEWWSILTIREHLK